MSIKLTRSVSSVPESLFQKFFFSRIGRNHLVDPRYIGFGNQDAFAMRDCRFGSVLAVADGSSAAFESKTGSCAAMRLVLNISEELLQLDPLPTPSEFAEKLQQRLLEGLRASILPLAGSDGNITAIVEQAYYFTLLVGVVTADWSAVIGSGDGFYAINGNIIKIDSRADNYPEYIGYLLCDPIPKGFEDVSMKVWEVIPTSKLKSIFVGSDGVGPVLNRKPNTNFSIKDLLTMGSPVQKDITEKMTELAEDGVELSVVSTAKQVTVEPKQLRGRFADDVTFVIFSKSARGVMNRDWTDYRNRHRVDSPAPLYTGPASLEQNKVETSIPTDTTEATDLGISKQQENPVDVPAEEKVPIPVPVNVEDEELQLNWWEKIVAWVKKFIASLNRDSQSKQ